MYYDLYNKYRSGYQVDEILTGKADDTIRERSRNAKFDERLSLIGLLLEAINGETRNCVRREAVLTRLLAALKAVKNGTEPLLVCLRRQIERENAKLSMGKQSASLSEDALYLTRCLIWELEDSLARLSEQKAPEFSDLKLEFDQKLARLKSAAQETVSHLDNLFSFCEDVFPDGQELLILVTELTLSEYSAKFIARYGCKAYFAHNKELLFYERQQELLEKLDALEDDL